MEADMSDETQEPGRLRIPSCNCGCGLSEIHPEMLLLARLLTEEFAEILWTSGSRCEQHNEKEKGSKHSGHLPIWGTERNKTVALDGTLSPWNSQRVRRILFRAIQHGATGIGYYPRKRNPSFHIDRKPRLQLWKPGPAGRLRYFF